MYLKRLELFGFKSFAERTALELTPGLIAVVGPNGSGKSNIADAVRWVLGEQSAQKLRGGKMEDVIFSGSESRRGVNVAEVTLVLDNADGRLPLDYAEVSVTRRLYRTGESEYLLGGLPVRMRDIAELFLDTGLGREAFAIIGQGQIDAILSQRPEDRRALFEEAAGIAKYKQRRKDAERKLAETEENIERVRDVLDALEKEWRPLQAEAERAERYLAVRRDYLALERDLIVYEIEQALEERDAALRRIAEQEAALASAEAEATRLGAERSTLSARLIELEGEIQRQEEALVKAATAIEKHEGELSVLAERARGRSERAFALARRREQVTSARTALSEEVAALEAEAEARSNDLGAAQREAEALRKELTVDEDPKARLEAEKTRYFDLLAAQTRLDGEVKRLSAALRRAEAARAELRERLVAAEAEQESLRAALSAAEAALASAEALAERRAAEAEAHRRRAETERQAMEEARRKKARAEERLAGILAEVRAYEAAERTGAGFQEGVRAVLKAAEEGRLSGIHGPVLTLFSVPEALTTAIDVVLGPAAMNIVVADEASAHAAIDYLKRGRLGRATFLPLDVLRARANPAEFEALRREMPGVLGPASELVESAPAYAVVRRFLLGGVLVVETLDTATAAARRLGYRHRIVTLDGELLHPGGSLTGGSSAKKSGAFTAREQAYAQFRAARRAAEAALAEAEAAYAQAAASYEAAVQEASAAAERLVAARRALAEAQAATDAARRQAEDAQAAVDRLSDADRVAEAEVQEMQRALEEAAEEARRAQAASDSAYAALKALEAAALERDHDASTKRARLAEVELSVARLEAALAAEQRLLDDKRAQLAAWEAEAEELLREAERLSQEDAEDRLRAEEVRAVLAEVRARRDRLSEDRMRLYAERESVRARVGVVETALEEQQRTIAALTATLAEDRLKAERAGDVLDRHLKHLGEVHERTYEAAREDARTLTAAEIDEVRRALREKKAELDAFGTVNVGAVEDAERLGARLAFYRTQLHDLDAAKAKLSRLIEEIDEEMRVRFWEAFQAIRRAYQETFERLFGGGKADLALEGDDPLTAGIDILAQPPGKKTRRLSLLSGGERALSAIALLFAVLSVRPVPFCVLDEVDAALDDANVGRFARFLQKLKDETQFIVITHRKGTMTSADVLFGVTMDRGGTSRVYAVELKDAERYAETM